MNLRPSGYEPDELPDCSTPHLKSVTIPGLAPERNAHLSPKKRAQRESGATIQAEQMPMTAACARIPRLAVSPGLPL